MSAQTEAERLADEISNDLSWVANWKAADELRRLHEVNQGLVEALRVCATQSTGPDWTPEQALAFIKQNARAAIAKTNQPQAGEQQ